MDTARMVHAMCHDILSEADVKAICKSRGFSDKEAATRALFENFFLSDLGVEAALRALNPAEVTLLHLLKFTGATVNITFFERIYGQPNSKNWYSTFNQRYQDVFRQVKSALIRRGLLLMAADENAWEGKTKLERWLFKFPPQFEKFLPPLFSSTKTFETLGDFRQDVLRRTIMGLIEGKGSTPLGKNEAYDLKLVNGELRMGKREFRAEYLLAWQRACWEAAVAAPAAKSPEEYLSPIAAVTYAFAQLRPNEWLLPDQLFLPLKIFCGDKHPSPEKICETGWQWGYLARHVAGATYYRLPQSQSQAVSKIEPGRYLQVTQDQEVCVDLAVVPYDSLEQLARISNLRVEQTGLVASPNLIRLGKVKEQVEGQPLVQWLYENAPAFRQVLETANQRWGRQIIHENLMLAKISDLSLKVTIQKALAEDKAVLFLPNDFIAFPGGLLPEIERLVSKAGHVIKTIQA